MTVPGWEGKRRAVIFPASLQNAAEGSPAFPVAFPRCPCGWSWHSAQPTSFPSDRIQVFFSPLLPPQNTREGYNSILQNIQLLPALIWSIVYSLYLVFALFQLSHFQNNRVFPSTSASHTLSVLQYLSEELHWNQFSECGIFLVDENVTMPYTWQIHYLPNALSYHLTKIPCSMLLQVFHATLIESIWKLDFIFQWKTKLKEK